MASGSTSQSTSPSREKKRKIHIEAERELFSQSLLKITDAETRGELRGKIEALINRTVDAELDRQSLIAENQTAIMEKESLMSDLRVARAELSMRPFIEVLQRRTVPIWLLNGEYESPSVKWAVSLEFQLTQGARILVDRINRFKNMNLDFGILDVSEMFSLTYDALSGTLSHDKKPREIELNEEEWNSLFEKLRIKDLDTQAAFKELVNPISREERQKAPPKDVKDEYVLYIKYLRINVREDGVQSTTDQIINVSGSHFAEKLYNFYYPVNAQRKYTNEVFIHAKQISLNEVKQLKNVLENFKLEGRDKVIFVYHALFKM